MQSKRIKCLEEKGQVLILFVIILPVLLLGIFALTAYFLTAYEKRKLTHIAEITCNYAMEEKDEKEIRALVYKNDSEIETIELDWGEHYVGITLEKKISILFLNRKVEVKTTIECTKSEGEV